MHRAPDGGPPLERAGRFAGQALESPLRRDYSIRAMTIRFRCALLTGAACSVVLPCAQAAGLYASLGLEVASEQIGASTSGVNHPTRCDRLLYSDPSAAPTDAACTDDTVRQILGGVFDLGEAFSGSASLGYAWERVRFEAEFLSRAHPGATVVLITARDNPALQGKASEWSPDNPPHHRVSDFRARQLFLNLIYEFGTDWAWTPFVGVGAGVADVRTAYTASFQRRTLADGYVAAAGGHPDQPEEWQLAAAGSLSQLDAEVSGEVFGYQIIVGAERALGERVSAFLTVRWTGVDDVSDDGVWTTIRSHRPVQADGVTPFTGRQALDDIGGFAATVGLRYEF